jgi:hypothetical protein
MDTKKTERPGKVISNRTKKQSKIKILVVAIFNTNLTKLKPTKNVKKTPIHTRDYDNHGHE